MLHLLLLPPPPQAGILQGEVDSLMVMDQWQASLMRALAQLQLRNSPETRSQLEERFDLDDEDEENDDEEEGDEDEEQQGGVVDPKA